ncbi:hypothetical protein GQ41_1174 [Arenibacter algicola]|uniref:Uncharacterized protein n=1 Tax=Arenibacter algicola TaxID=616991 RepID=A0ABY3ACW5_9FLAO
MKLEIILMDSPLFFKCPVSGEVIIDEEEGVSNVPSSATEFIYYDGEFEFRKDWVEKAYRDNLTDFIKSESNHTENIVCYELIMGSGASLDKVHIGIRN